MAQLISAMPHSRRRPADLDAMQSNIDQIVNEAVRQALATVDTRPIALDLKAAMEYTGLSKTSLNNLLREEKVVARKEGTKNLFLRASLDRYINSLPAWGSRAA